MSGWKLDDGFSTRIASTFGPEGADWLDDLPERVERLTGRWGIEEITPCADLNYAWVAFARCSSGPVVVKLMASPGEFRAEVYALLRFPAGSACRLLDRDVDASAMLLERLVPGTALREVRSFATRVEVAADTMRRLHYGRRSARRPGVQRDELPPQPPPSYADQARRAWLSAMGRLAGSPAGWEASLLESARRARGLLHATACGGTRPGRAGEPLLHADLHHDNILRAGHAWRCIDPKGVTGPLALEPARFIVNQFDEAPADQRERQFHRMVGVFASALGVEPSAVAAGAAVDAAVSACWSLEDGECDAEMKRTAHRAAAIRGFAQGWLED
ncbi:MAG: aminoglycoside phosphotransferase family protein [Spirochaetota bacterium]